VPQDANEGQMEQLRIELQDRLDRVTRRAYQIVGRSEGIADGQ
jgi:hypothetical protein